MQKLLSAIGVVIFAVACMGIGYAIGATHSPVKLDEQLSSSSDAIMMDHDMSTMEHTDGMSMDEMMGTMNAELMNKDGDAFDQAFLENMIVHHEGAVTMAEMALEHAGHQEIKDLAQAIIAAQKQEIADMQAWQAEWYGE